MKSVDQIKTEIINNNGVGGIVFKFGSLEKHFDLLENLVGDNETCKYAFSEGKGLKIRLIVVTETRIFAILKPNRGNFHSINKQIMIKDISEISLNNKLMGNDILMKLRSTENFDLIKIMDSTYSQKIVNYLVSQRDYLNKTSEKTNLDNSLSKYDEIEKIYNLFRKGIITREEFETEKNKILNLANES